MYYSEMIWNLWYFERKKVPEIIARMNIPLITEQYVRTVIKNNEQLRKPASSDHPSRVPINKKLRSIREMRIRTKRHRRRKLDLKKLTW